MTDTHKTTELFRKKPVVINVGTRLFGEAAEKQGVEVIQVDWRPVAGGDAQLQSILEDLGF